MGKGDAPFNESEPSEKFYRFFTRFSKKFFLRKEEEYKEKFFRKSLPIIWMILSPFLLILYFFNQLFNILNKNINSFYWIKAQYRCSIYLYKILLTLDFFTLGDILKILNNVFKRFL